MGDEEDEAKPPPTVFISRVDTFFGRILAQHLGTSVPGPVEEPEEPDEAPTAPDTAFLTSPSNPNAFHVTGSWRPLPDPDSITVPPKPTGPPTVPAAKILTRADKEFDRNKLLENADICVFNIFEDCGENRVLEDALEAVTFAKESALKKKKKVTFILVSTTMTWALTKKPGDDTENPPPPVDLPEEEDEEEGFTEETYRKRRTHPAYRRHLELEKDVLKYGRDSGGLLTTTVVGVGLVYGLGEDGLHWMLRDAWEGRDAVRLPGDGRVKVPMIHARDLCRVVQNVCENRPKRRYILAVDGGNARIQKMAEAVSVQLGSGIIENIHPTKLLTHQLINQTHHDLLTTHLHFTQGTVKEEMHFPWTAETGLLGALPKVIHEYRLVRHLTPLRILVTGPPCCGKTLLAHRLVDHYHLHYLDIEEVVEHAVMLLKKYIDTEMKRKAGLTEEEVENEPEDELAKLDTSKELLQKVTESREVTGKVGEEFVVRFVKETLESNPCKNQGYVLDNFPDTYDRAKQVFGGGHGEDDEEEDEPEEQGDESMPAVFPEFVFYLDGPEEFIRKRVMERPDTPGPSTAPTSEAQYLARLAAYHAAHPNNDNGIIRYADEHRHPLHILLLTRDPDPALSLTFATVLGIIGPPHNYGSSKNDRLDEQRFLDEQHQMTLDNEAEVGKRQEEEGLRQRRERCSEWAGQLRAYHQARSGKVAEGTGKVTEYLGRCVLPAVMEGLLETVRVRPEDPVDFLGECLLQLANPEKVQPPLTTNQKLARVARL